MKFEKMKENTLYLLEQGWEASVNLPVAMFESDEKIQIVEAMLEKIAMKHHHDNY